MAQSKIAQPDNQEIADDWSQLFNSVGLELIANVSLHISQPETK